MVVYVHGCTSCGRNGRQIQRLMTYCRENALDLEIKHSDGNAENAQEHFEWLYKAGLPSSSYTAIVVDNGKVTRLREWNL